jgi:hypothetical protein
MGDDGDGSRRRKQVAKKSTGPPPSRVATRSRFSSSGNFLTNATSYADPSSDEADATDDDLASIANTGPADLYTSVRQSYQEAQVNWDPTVAENPVLRSANEVGHFGDSDADSVSEHGSRHEGATAVVPRDRSTRFAPYRWIRRFEQEAARALRENSRYSQVAVS